MLVHIDMTILLQRHCSLSKKESGLLTHFAIHLKYNENVEAFQMSQIDNLLQYMKMHLV